MVEGPKPEAVCGHCGGRYDKHYFETEIFCFPNTTGDIYTEEPNDDIIFEMITESDPDLYDKMVKKWKEENGHLEPPNQKG